MTVIPAKAEIHDLSNLRVFNVSLAVIGHIALTKLNLIPRQTDYIFSQFFFLPFQADDISLLGYFFIFV